MRSLRRTIRLKDGVEVKTLFTPHLFSFKEETGLTLEADPENKVSIMEVYADIYYLAALNAWVLDGSGPAEAFPYTRGDFHEYMATNPRQFAADVDFAVQALTGKTTRELVSEKLGKAEEQEVQQGKKKPSGWIGRLLRRS